MLVVAVAGCTNAWRTVDDTPAPAGAPRLIAPLSGQTVVSRRPVLTFDGSGDVDLCADRACNVVLATEPSGKGAVQPRRELPPGVVWWRARSASGTSATWQMVVGPNNPDIATVAGGVMPDFDGDGLADVAVGLPARGVVVVYRGTTDGLTIARSITAPKGSAGFGGAVAPAGDVDGDGYGDLIVGAHLTEGEIGAAFVYRGGPSGLSATRMIPLFLEDLDPGAKLGWAVAAAGDVDRDGFGDVLVGAPGAEDRLGRIFVFRGSDEGTFQRPAYSHSAGDLVDDEAPEFGHSVAGGGDLNGDGFADIVVGAPGSDGGSGRAYVFFGGKTGSRKPLGWLAPEEVKDGAFGWSVAAAGDVDGNGAHDLVVGAPDAGRAFLILSRPYAEPPGDMIALGAPEPRKNAGLAVALIGDVDGDGLADHAVAGADGLVVYQGQNATHTVPAAEAPALVPAGDVNGDGKADLVWGSFPKGAPAILTVQTPGAGDATKLEIRTP